MYKISATTAQGTREYNEDRFIIKYGEDFVWAVVADGMGGHANGDAAAQEAVDTLALLIEDFKELFANNFGENEFAIAHALIAEAFVELNRGLNQYGDGRGTTAVCALVTPRRTLLVSMGDSYAYTVHERCTKALMPLDSGPYGGLTNCLGADTANNEPHVFAIENNYDYVVLATDGIFSPFSISHPAEYSDDLASKIMEQGMSTYNFQSRTDSNDNTTVVVIGL